jgi:hypothetical protein
MSLLQREHGPEDYDSEGDLIGVDRRWDDDDSWLSPASSLPTAAPASMSVSVSHSGRPGLPGLAKCYFCRMDPPDHLGRDCPLRALGGPAPGFAPPPGAYAKAPPPLAYANPYRAEAAPALAGAPAPADAWVVVDEAPLGTTLALAASRTTLALAGVASPPLTQTSAASSASLAPGQICGSGTNGPQEPL